MFAPSPLEDSEAGILSVLRERRSLVDTVSKELTKIVSLHISNR